MKPVEYSKTGHPDAPGFQLGEDPPSPAQLRQIAAKIYRYYQTASGRKDSRLVPSRAGKNAPEIKSFLAAVARQPFFDTWKAGIDHADHLLSLEGHGLQKANWRTLWRLAEDATSDARAKGAVLKVDAIASHFYDDWFPGRPKETVSAVSVSAERQETVVDVATPSPRPFNPMPPAEARVYDKVYEKRPELEPFLAFVADVIGESLTELFFGKLQIADVTPESMLLIAPNQHYISWLTTRHAEVIRRAVRALFGKDIRVFFGHREQTGPALFELNWDKLDEMPQNESRDIA